MKVCCVYSFESPQNIPFPIQNKKITLNLQLRQFFLGTQERVRNSRGKPAISVRATEVLLHNVINDFFLFLINIREDFYGH